MAVSTPQLPIAKKKTLPTPSYGLQFRRCWPPMRMQQERMFASLTAAFGVLALALACVGIYGIMAYTVSQRKNEIGINWRWGRS
jgi:ABC-type antimicrobial peptide transport system permease subunit